jgi:hypothetical protein
VSDLFDTEATVFITFLDYPDYYVTIKHPIAMNIILRSMYHESGEERKADDFFSQLQ